MTGTYASPIGAVHQLQYHLLSGEESGFVGSRNLPRSLRNSERRSASQASLAPAIPLHWPVGRSLARQLGAALAAVSTAL